MLSKFSNLVVEYHISSFVHFKLSYLISFLSVLGLRCYAWAFSSCGGSSCCRLQASVVVAHGFSCLAACGIFLDQGLNPCALHGQADPYPLLPPGKSFFSFLRENCILVVCLKFCKYFSHYYYFIFVCVYIYTHTYTY